MTFATGVYSRKKSAKSPCRMNIFAAVASGSLYEKNMVPVVLRLPQRFASGGASQHWHWHPVAGIPGSRGRSPGGGG
jgi:hypothetical protein